MNEEFEFDEDNLEIPQPVKIDLSSLPKFNGKCHDCEEPVEEGKLFCDKSCREIYMKRYFRQYGKYPMI